MNINLPLEQMSTSEKISVMEKIWDDLCKNTSTMTPPAWHKDILNQRENDIEQGKESFTEWEKAKINIRQAVK